jgi:hypothetical protein
MHCVTQERARNRSGPTDLPGATNRNSALQGALSQKQEPMRPSAVLRRMRPASAGPHFLREDPRERLR